MRKIQNQLLMLFMIMLVSIACRTSLTAQNPNYPVKQIQGKNCYVYTVQQGEGLYRISKNFGVSQAEINDLNPQAENGLQAGMEIYIPTNQPVTTDKTNISTQKNKEPEFIEHTVEKKQTVFAICQKYQITQEELFAANPQITKNKVKAGEKIRIPVKKSIEEETTAQVDIKNQKPIILPQEPRTTPYKIGFMLPFMLSQPKADQTVKRFLDFYSGAVVALNDAKRDGMSFEIYTYDTEKTETSMAESLNDSSLKNMDLIIGPAYSNQVGLISDFARTNRIQTLIPFSSKIYDIETNPFLYQYNPGKDVETEKMMQIIQDKFKNANIVFVELPSAAANDEFGILQKDIQDEMSIQNMEFQKLQINDSVNVLKALRSDKKNLFFFNTSKINLAANHLKLLRNSSDSSLITVFEPASWLESNIVKPQSICISPFRKSYESSTYSNYQSKYLELFNYFPENALTRYDILGYDLMNYFIQHIFKFSSTSEKLRFPLYKGIQSDIQFQRSDKRSGFMNKQFEVIQKK